jgi:hypothetical protein
MRLRTLLPLAAIVLTGCHTSTAPIDTSLDGPWTSHTLSVDVLINLTWTADSVKGSGTYTVIRNTLGCGGGTLTGNGAVDFAASRSGNALSGHMAFDNGWTPPFSGTLTSDIIAGRFMSVDAGTCDYTLFHGLVP